MPFQSQKVLSLFFSNCLLSIDSKRLLKNREAGFDLAPLDSESVRSILHDVNLFMAEFTPDQIEDRHSCDPISDSKRVKFCLKTAYEAHLLGRSLQEHLSDRYNLDIGRFLTNLYPFDNGRESSMWIFVFQDNQFKIRPYHASKSELCLPIKEHHTNVSGLKDASYAGELVVTYEANKITITFNPQSGRFKPKASKCVLYYSLFVQSVVLQMRSTVGRTGEVSVILDSSVRESSPLIKRRGKLGRDIGDCK